MGHSIGLQAPATRTSQHPTSGGAQHSTPHITRRVWVILRSNIREKTAPTRFRHIYLTRCVDSKRSCRLAQATLRPGAKETKRCRSCRAWSQPGFLLVVVLGSMHHHSVLCRRISVAISFTTCLTPRQVPMKPPEQMIGAVHQYLEDGQMARKDKGERPPRESPSVRILSRHCSMRGQREREERERERGRRTREKREREERERREREKRERERERERCAPSGLSVVGCRSASEGWVID